MWALLWTQESWLGKARIRSRFWVESVVSYEVDSCTVVLGNDASTVVPGVPLSELAAVRIG